MKKLILISGLILMVSCQEKSKLDPNINPFFQEWTTPFEVPPFMDIKNEDYMHIIFILNIHERGDLKWCSPFLEKRIDIRV